MPKPLLSRVEPYRTGAASDTHDSLLLVNDPNEYVQLMYVLVGQPLRDRLGKSNDEILAMLVELLGGEGVTSISSP